MANLCDTEYKFFGDIGEIKDLYDKIREIQAITKKDYVSIPFSVVAEFFNLDGEIDLRGNIYNYTLLENSVLWLSMSTAWHENSAFWDKVIAPYKNISYYYRAEECGCDYFYNSDPTGEYFPELYYIDQCDHDCGYATDDDELFDDIAKRLDVEKIESFEQLDELLEAYNEENEDTAIYYHKFSEPN